MQFPCRRERVCVQFPSLLKRLNAIQTAHLVSRPTEEKDGKSHAGNDMIIKSFGWGGFSSSYKFSFGLFHITAFV